LSPRSGIACRCEFGSVLLLDVSFSLGSFLPDGGFALGQCAL
jgi:hypothetical protein